MTLQGTLVAMVSLLGLAAFVVRLTLRGRLYVGYATIWLACLAAGGSLLAVPSLLGYVTAAVGAIFPVSAVTFLALVGIFLVLIYFSCQLTILSNRVTAMAQYVALRDVGRSDPATRDDVSP